MRSQIRAALLLLFVVAATRASAQIPGATLTPITIPSGVSFWHIAPATDGSLWVSDIGNVKRLGRIASDGTFTGYPLTGFGVNPLPYSLTTGPDGNLWFTVAQKTLDGSPAGGAIGRMTPSGTMTAFPVPTGTAFDNAFGAPITLGPDGNLWFLEQTAGKIAKITTSGAITEYPIPTASAFPQGIAGGPDGNVWFTEYGGKVGRITPSGTVTEFTVGGGLFLSGICNGPDGNLWFTAGGSSGSKIGRITPQGAVTTFLVSTSSRGLAGIVTGQDGNLYFAESNAAKIGQLVPATGAVTESAEPLGRQPSELVITSGTFGVASRTTLASGSAVNLAYPALQATPTSFDHGLGLFRIAGTTVCTTPNAPLAVSVRRIFGGYELKIEGASGPLPQGDVYEFQTWNGPVPPSEEEPGHIFRTTSPYQADRNYYSGVEYKGGDRYARARIVRTCPDGSYRKSQWTAIALDADADPPTPHLDATVMTCTGGSVDCSSSARFVVQNTGDAATNLTGTLVGSALTNTMELSPPSATLGPGQNQTFVASLKSSTGPGIFTGVVKFDSGTGGYIYVPVFVTVPPAPVAPGTVPGEIKIAGDDGLSQFIFRGSVPVNATISYTGAASPGPVFPSAAIDLSGAFLDLRGMPYQITTPVVFPLNVDLTRVRATDGCCPWAYLHLSPFGGTAYSEAKLIALAYKFEVLRGRNRSPSPNLKASRTADIAAPPSGTSIVIPTAVNASNAAFNVTYRSDAWIRNESIVDATATLYYTPDGADGLVGATVLETNVPLPAMSTTLLPDLVGTIFGQTGSGQIEIRSASAPFLTVRSTTEATTGGDPTKRFGTEVPAVVWGSGAALGGSEAVIPVVSDDATNRTNLILAETSGSAATVSVTVYDATGSTLGSVSPNPVVPPYGKIQLNRLVSLVAPGATLSGGWASVRVVSGSGTVVPVATVLDNASNSFSAVRGRFSASGAGLAPFFASSVIVPSLARLTGAFSTFFVSSLRLVNAGSAPANLTLTYFYNDRTSGEARSAQKTMTLPPRGALAKAIGDDVLGSLFGLTAETYGWIRITGDVANLAAVAAVSAQVDNANPSKGLKTSQVDGVVSSAPEVMGLFDEARRFMGVESSNVKRTNLILVETAGQAGTALVAIQDRLGYTLGQKSYPIAANQYLQINNVVSDVGGAIGQGTWLDVIVSVRVTAGNSRVVSFATVNDNVSRNPEIFLLRPPGPPSRFGAY